MTEKKKADVINFPVPIVGHHESQNKEKLEQAVSTMHTRMDDYDKKKELYERIRVECVKNGFGATAIVSFKYSHGIKSALNPSNWGVVIGLSHYHMDPTKFRPIQVRWLTERKPDSEHNMEDLFLIHEAVQSEDLEIALMFQEEEMKEC